MKKLSLILIGLLLMAGTAITGCIKYNVDIEKFPVYDQSMQSFSGGDPIQVIIPQDAEEEYIIENLNSFIGKGATLVVNFNSLYKIGDELISEVLEQHQIKINNNSAKYLKFTIEKIQYENWGLYVQGVYFYFIIETSDGYQQQYKVQDQSGWNLDRAVSGAVSRAVERIFQDRKVIEFIESSK